MAGRQVKIYLHPDDRREVESFVTAQLDSALLAPRWKTTTPQRVSSSQGQLALICPNSLIDSLHPRHIKSRDEWVLSAGHDPVIEWWHSKLEGSNLYPGRIYYVPGSDEMAVGTEGERLLGSVAGNLMRWIKEFARKTEVDWGYEYVSPQAAIKLVDGELHLRRNPPGSRI